VVPDPVKVAREMQRLPARGRIIVLNHFLSPNPLLCAPSGSSRRSPFTSDSRPISDLPAFLAQAALQPVSIEKVNIPVSGRSSRASGLSRPIWLAAVIIAFCLPLFVGLGRTDMENDEAIYSYAVDRILATGDWLNPPLSPFEETTFLEKPPLKFWIVAAPIRLGALPHDELGMRVWDALFGAMAFVYVFAIGRRLAGPTCGFVAVFVLFVYQPLLFQHGLRNNNMEAPLVLCYCGAVYHYLVWVANERPNRRRHIAAIWLSSSSGS
jgi:hypothetical protein